MELARFSALLKIQDGAKSTKLPLKVQHYIDNIYEYERQGPAPRAFFWPKLISSASPFHTWVLGGWVEGFWQEIITLPGSILQAETCQIFSLDENL